MRGRIFRATLGAIGIFVLGATAQAGDFFGLSATGSDGTTASANSSSLLNVVDNLINARSQFSTLVGKSFTGSLTYGGVPNALLFSENASQTSATITIPATGFTQTFTGTSPSQVQDEIRDFIKHNGAGAYAEFTRAINQESPVAAVDGNPQAFTEFVATDAFERFGINPTLSQQPTGEGDIGQFRVEATGGYLRASGLDGAYADLSLGSDIRFNNNVALTLGTALQYRDTGGAETYFVAEEVGLPITIINQTDTGFAWRVTPWAFGGVGASTDQVDGAVLVGGGGTSSASIGFGDFRFTLADQVSYASGIPVAIDDYSFDTYVNQWIIKNGGKVTYTPGQGAFFVDAGISYSNLLHHGAVPSYWTPEAGIGFMFGKYSGIRLDYSDDFASGFTDNGGRLTLFLSY